MQEYEQYNLGSTSQTCRIWKPVQGLKNTCLFIPPSFSFDLAVYKNGGTQKVVPIKISYQNGVEKCNHTPFCYRKTMVHLIDE